MTAPLLSVRGVSKCYPLYANQRSRLRHALWPASRQGVEEVWALREIDFDLLAGESVAIIGRNGSGKSTLLEIITGTMAPTTGQVSVQGRVAALLELGSGFHPEYSGRDNVYLNAQLLGMTRQQVHERFADIAAFADIGDVLDHPVKTYSSGMLVRLAFAVQIALDPQILIVDEALSVGDYFFQQKCFRRLRQMRDNGLTLLFVSHDMGAVRDLCSRAIYLQRGHLVWDGEVNAAIQRYLTEESSTEAVELVPAEDGLAVPSAAPWGAEVLWQRPALADSVTKIVAVAVEDSAGNAALAARIGETLRFVVWYQAAEVSPVHVSVVLKNRYDQVVNCTSSYTLGLTMPACLEQDVAVFTLELGMQLEAGEYSLQVSLGVVGAKANQGVTLDETPWLGPLTVRWDYSAAAPPFYGMFGLPARASMSALHPLTS